MGKNMPNIDKDVQKEAVKEALKEWLNEKYASVGRWTVHGLIASALVGLVYLALIGLGYHK